MSLENTLPFIKAYECIQENRSLTPADKDILQYLLRLYFINSSPIFRVTEKTLSKKNGVDERTIRRAKQKLKSIGLITYNSKKEEGMNSTAEYTLYPERINEYFGATIIPIETEDDITKDSRSDASSKSKSITMEQQPPKNNRIINGCKVPNRKKQETKWQ